MILSRVLLAGFVSWIVYFIMGGLLFAMSPLKHEYAKFPNIYRTPETMKPVAPIGMLSMLLSMFALAALYAATWHGQPWLMHGAKFGAVVAVFMLGSFTIHNHVNLNISARLTTGQAVAYTVQWIVAGLVIAAMYHPAVAG